MPNRLRLRVAPFRRGAWRVVVALAVPAAWVIACGGESKAPADPSPAGTATANPSAAWHVTPPYAWSAVAAPSASAAASVKPPPAPLPPPPPATATAKDTD